MVKFIIPLNQKTTFGHMKEAGWNPVFFTNSGESGEPGVAVNNQLNEGLVYRVGYETPFPITQARSLDITKFVSTGYFDVALVGNDCIEETSYNRVICLRNFPYGRGWGIDAPRLELVAHRDSTISDVEDIPHGAVILTEEPIITKSYLEGKGFRTIVEGVESHESFRQRLAETGSIGISRVLGNVPVLVNSDQYFGVMVNESGGTVRANHLRVIDLIRKIDTVLIASPQAMQDEAKSELIYQFQQDLEGAYFKIQQEYETSHLNGPERAQF